MIAGILGALLTPTIIKTVAGTLFDKGANIFGQYLNKKVSEEEAKAKLAQALAESMADVEQSHADALAKTVTAFYSTFTYPMVRRVWAVVTLSQLAIILWHQWGVPFLTMLCWRGSVSFGNGACNYPSSGGTAEWSYLLLAGCIGMAPVVLRAGPGAGSIADRLRSLVQR